jgi:hypothetical protein
MVYTKTLLPGESQCQNSSGKCPSSPTFTWRSFLRLRAQSQPEVVGSSERGCNSSASASVTQAGHLRPLDVRRRGFGLLPDGQGLEELNRAEWASRIPLRLRVQKGGSSNGPSKKGFVRCGVLQQAVLWGCLRRSTLKIPKLEAKKAIDASLPRWNERQVGGVRTSDGEG